MTRPPTYVDYLYPIADAFRATPMTPLVHVASEHDLRSTTVLDPVLGDATNCFDLAQRDVDCWTALARTYPPKYSYALSPAERQQAAAARAVCRRRAAPLLNTCRVGSVRVG